MSWTSALAGAPSAAPLGRPAAVGAAARAGTRKIISTTLASRLAVKRAIRRIGGLLDDRQFPDLLLGRIRRPQGALRPNPDFAARMSRCAPRKHPSCRGGPGVVRGMAKILAISSHMARGHV